MAARGERSPGRPAGSLPPASATRAAAGQPRLGQESQIAVHLRPAETRSRDSPSGAWKGTTCPGRRLATLSLNELRVRKDVPACHPRKCPPPHANLSSGQRVGEAAGGGDAGKRRPPAGAKTKPGPEAHANTLTRRPVPPPPPPVATATRPPATPHRVLTQITFSRSKIGIAGRRAPLNNSQAL